jgi:hypothetical protein
MPTGNMDESDFNEVLDVEKRKFEIDGNSSIQSEKEYHLPSEYGNTKITLLVQSPFRLYAFWEISENMNISFGDLKGKEFIIRMHYTDSDVFYDTEVKSGALSLYLQIPEAGRSYYAELGLFENNGNFLSLAKSNTVAVPANKAASDPYRQETDSKDLFNLSGEEHLGKLEGSEKNPCPK